MTRTYTKSFLLPRLLRSRLYLPFLLPLAREMEFGISQALAREVFSDYFTSRGLWNLRRPVKCGAASLGLGP